MGRRPLVAMVLGWLAVVVAVGAITFVVVDRAGRGVGQASAVEVVALLPSDTPRPASPTPTSTPRDTASFTTDGGTVVASCDGEEMSLDSIRPRDGWRFEKQSEHGGLEVLFRSGSRQVELLLDCVQGAPTRVAHDD